MLGVWLVVGKESLSEQAPGPQSNGCRRRARQGRESPGPDKAMGRGLLGCIADLLLASTEELLVLLLSLLEGILEQVGVCNGQSKCPIGPRNGSLTLAVGKADSQSLSLGLALADIGGGVPNPAAVTADVGAQLHVGDN